MHCTTGYYLKGGLVYLTMPTMGTTEDYIGMIFFPDVVQLCSLENKFEKIISDAAPYTITMALKVCWKVTICML
jgi:hypothetical protein